MIGFSSDYGLFLYCCTQKGKESGIIYVSVINMSWKIEKFINKKPLPSVRSKNV